MNTLYFIAAIAVISVTLYLVFGRSKKPSVNPPENPPGNTPDIDPTNWKNTPIGHVPTSRDNRQNTALGLSLFSNITVPASALDAMDSAYLFECDRAMRSGYKNIPTLDRVELYIPKFGCIPSPEQRVPSFLVRANKEWDGTIYDQLPEPGYAAIFAAEMVVSNGTAGDKVQIIVCQDNAYESTRNGMQHTLIAHNNPALYAATITPDHVHPLEYAPAAVSLKAPDQTVLAEPAITPVR